MTRPSHPTTCLRCGQGLAVNPARHDIATYICHGCRRGYWPGELSVTARALFRRDYHDFGRARDAKAVHDAVAGDLEQASLRGHNVPDDARELLSPFSARALKTLETRILNARRGG